MKRSVTFWNIYGALLLTTMAWSAPKTARHRTSRPRAVKLAPISAIEIYHDDGGVGGRSAGGGQGWTLRPDGIAVHSVSFNPRDMDELGDSYIPTMSGSFNRNDFTELVRYLQSSRLLDLKAPRGADDGSGSLTVSLVRSGKRKSITISDGAPPSAAVTGGWVMLNLVRGITAETDWQDAAGHAVNTGLRAHFVRTAAGLTSDQSYAVDTPIFAVLNGAGKAVATLSVSTPSGYCSRVLPPGTYHLVLKKLDSSGGTPQPPPTGYDWRAVPATAQVEAGSMTPVTIGLAKLPASP